MITDGTMQTGIIKMIYPVKHNWGVGSDGVSDLYFYHNLLGTFWSALFCLHVHDFLSVILFENGF